MKRLICLMLSFLMIFLTGCSQSNLESNKIVIAVMGSKEVYDYDNSFLNGVQMAVEECNAQYGDIVSTSVEYFFDEYDFEKGLIESNLIAEDSKYTAVIGSHSFSILEATAPIFEKNNKILLAANSMMDKDIVDKGYKLIFRNTLGEKEMGESLAIYAREKGLDRIAVCHSGTEFELNLVKVFSTDARDYGISVLDFTTSVGSEREFEKTNIMWNALGIKGVLISHEQIYDAFTLAKYIRNFDKSMTILGDFSFDASENLIKFEPFVQGVIIPTLIPITLSNEYDNLNKRYFEKYNESPTWWASHGYDSVRIIVDSAVSINSTDPNAIAEKMHSTAGYNGVTGNIAFDKNGALIIQQNLYSEVSGSEFVFKTLDH